MMACKLVVSHAVVTIPYIYPTSSTTPMCLPFISLLARDQRREARQDQVPSTIACSRKQQMFPHTSAHLRPTSHHEEDLTDCRPQKFPKFQPTPELFVCQAFRFVDIIANSYKCYHKTSILPRLNIQMSAIRFLFFLATLSTDSSFCDDFKPQIQFWAPSHTTSRLFGFAGSNGSPTV
jgi:hypothetical protein